MERCPCCRARLRETDRCPRCQADLGWVIRSETVSRDWLALAIRAWCAGEPDVSLTALGRSLQLKKSVLALSFRDYLIRRELPNLFQLLVSNDFVKARQKALALYRLDPRNIVLAQLQAFAVFLPGKEQ